MRSPVLPGCHWNSLTAQPQCMSVLLRLKGAYLYQRSQRYKRTPLRADFAEKNMRDCGDNMGREEESNSGRKYAAH